METFRLNGYVALYIVIISTIIFTGPFLKPFALWGSQSNRFVPKEEIITAMHVGEAGYTVPWSISIDENGKPWLDRYVVVTPNCGGTAAVLVSRTKTGFEVNISQTKYARNWHWAKEQINNFRKTDPFPASFAQ
jgi:hypothetical protein